MSALKIALLLAITISNLNAKPQKDSIDGDGFDLMIIHDSVSVTPIPSEIQDSSGGPFFIAIEVANSREELNDRSKTVKSTQGVPTNGEKIMPIALTLPPGGHRIIRITVLSDACFSGWERSHTFEVSSEGITELAQEPTEQGGAGETATRSKSDSQGGDKPQPDSEGRSR